MILSWRELCVESLGHCQHVGNWMFRRGFARNGEPKSISFPGRTLCQPAVGRMVVRRGIETFRGISDSLWKLCPKFLCQLRGSLQKVGSNLGPTTDKLGPKPCTMTQHKARRTNQIAFLPLPWAQEVSGSNPDAPTKTSRVFSLGKQRPACAISSNLTARIQLFAIHSEI